MLVRAITFIISVLCLTTVLEGCGDGADGSHAPEVESLAELESHEEAQRQEQFDDPDTLDLVPGRTAILFGDLADIQARGVIRVLITPSRTNYFDDDGRERGFEYELLREYERSLNKRTPGRFVMVFLPIPFSELLPALVEGRGDIAAAGITITPERLESVSFSMPYLTDIDEIVVGHSSGQILDSLADLGGKRVTVVRGSSFVLHLLKLNEELERAGHERIKVALAPRYLEAEDLLELVDAGRIDYTVVDEHIGTLWSSVLENIVLHQHIPIRTGNRIAWAVRPEDVKLREDLDTFVRKHKKGSLLGNVIFNRYYDDSKWIDKGAGIEDDQFAEHRKWTMKYAEQYGFDWLLMGALAYQESRFDQNAKSSAGAVGLFQIKPAIAAAPPIGIDDVHELQNNIHAGIKYLAHIRDHYFSDPELSDVARLDLALAAYNAGPTRVSRFRRRATEKGYDPNVWFGNVERLAARETIRYVANINKHYYALLLTRHALKERAEEIEDIGG